MSLTTDTAPHLAGVHHLKLPVSNLNRSGSGTSPGSGTAPSRSSVRRAG
jgi:hypothetical protein